MDIKDKIDLLSADLFDETSRDEQSALESWKAERADNRKLHELLKSIKLSSDVTEYAENVREDIRDQLNSRINKLSFRLRWMSISAAVITSLIILGGTGYLSYYTGYKKQSNQFVTLATPRGTISSVILPDSSKVTLNAGAILVYPTAFTGKERKVKITGEGFFEITPDVSHPFVVSADDILVRVLGTKFNVKTLDEVSSITLVEGKVQVSINEIEKKILLNANEKAIYTKAENAVTVLPVNAQNEISWIENKLIFDDQPLSEVLKTLSRHYGVTFDLQHYDIDAINLTMTISNETLEEALEYIRRATDINYELLKNNPAKDTTTNYHVVLTP